MAQNPIVDQEHFTEFMTVYAQICLAWQLVEQNIYFILCSLVKSAAPTPVVSAVYHSIINFNTRLDAVDASMKMAFRGNAKLQEWEELLGNIFNCSKHRNKVAHSTIKVHHNRGEHTFRLAPSAFDVREEHDVDYTLGQMRGWKREIFDLAQRISEFGVSIDAGGTLIFHRDIYFPNQQPIVGQ